MNSRKFSFPSEGSVSYRQSYRRCGKPTCSTCRNGVGHGPYWYATWREGAKVRTAYVGREQPPEPQPLSVRTLGSLHVTLPSGASVSWPKRQRELFTLLLSAPNGVVPRDEVADTLWPDSDGLKAHQSMRATVSALQRLLGSRTLVRMEGPVVALSLPAGSRDDVLFEQAARVALATASVGGMITAIELFGGVYLSEVLYSDWTGYRRRMLSDLRRHLVLRAAGAGAAGADRSTIAGWLEELLRDDPCDEGAARLLMRRYLEEGNRTAALRLYRRLVTALKQDLEADPEPETVAMLKVMRHTE
ncbi:MAG TPA: DUF6788 family protein [Chloroflexota bacterium]|nr:DUF6788 family protein [Chloroflexota bacterium]